MQRSRSILALLAVLSMFSSAAPASAAAPVKEVQVVGPRVLLADVVPSAPAALATVDLGPAPAPGGSRFVTQEDLRKAATGASAKLLASLPPAVRLVRKMKKLTAADIEREARKAIAAAGLRKGVTLQSVRAPKLAEVAEGWTSITAQVPRPPRRTGKLPSTATLTFSRGAEVLSRIAVPIDLDLSAQAAIPDIAKGAALTVTVRAGLVEISASAMASADADIGEELVVTLRPSGRVLRAVLTASDKALIVAPSQPAATTDTAAQPAATAATATSTVTATATTSSTSSATTITLSPVQPTASSVASAATPAAPSPAPAAP